MTVEELIEVLRELPPTSRVDVEMDDLLGAPISASYERAITTIRCEPLTEETEDNG